MLKKVVGQKNKLTDQTVSDKLKISELRYRRLFEAAQDGILILDFKTGMIVDVNKFLIDLLGYSKGTFLNKYLWEIGIFKDVAASKRKFSILQKKRYVRFENLPLETKSGKKVNVEFVANAYMVGNDLVIQCNIRDITDRRVIQELFLAEKAKDEAILSSIGDAVFACDKNGKIILFNVMAQKLTGITEEQAVGKHYNKTLKFINELNLKPNDDFIIEAIAKSKTTKARNHTMLVRNDGGRIQVSTSAAPIKDINNFTTGSVVVFHDVTREREIDKTKTEFVSLASHQLRTPLTAINWNCELMTTSKKWALNKDQLQLMREVRVSSKRMVILVDTLLNVSNLELGTFSINPEPINFIDLMEFCIKDVNPKIEEKKLVLRRNFDTNIPIISADKRLLFIILENLLSNAVKYTPNAHKINLTIKKEDESVVIMVADTGIGIPVPQQKHIFTKLFRADNAKVVDSDGPGLGLYIVKEILDHSGGKIRFESKEGKGTTFYVTIPLSGMIKKEGSKQLI